MNCLPLWMASSVVSVSCIQTLSGRSQIGGGRGTRGSGVAVLRHRSVGLAWRRRFERGRIVTNAYGGSFETQARLSEQPVLTLYELLEIPQEVGLSEIKTAYRQLARRYHPDVCPPAARDECTKKFLQVQEAYEILADPDLRADYDYRLRNPLSMQVPTSGFSQDVRRHRSSTPAKEEWKAQWESQLEGLKRPGRRKPNSWAERMRQQRAEQADVVA